MDFFGYFVVSEPRTSHLVEHAMALGRAFSSTGGFYGTGVKQITATLLLTDPSRGKLHRTKRPKYFPGTRLIRAHGLSAKSEDALEFSIWPSFDAVSSASNERDLAAAISPTIASIAPELLKLKVPNFSMQRFLSDLEHFLKRAATQGVVVH